MLKRLMEVKEDKKIVYGSIMSFLIISNWLKYFMISRNLKTLQDEEPELYEEVKDDISSDVTVYYDPNRNSLPQYSYLFPHKWKKIIVNKEATKSLNKFIIYHGIGNTNQLFLSRNLIVYTSILYPLFLLYPSLDSLILIAFLAFQKMSKYDADKYALSKLSLEDLIELDDELLQKISYYKMINRIDSDDNTYSILFGYNSINRDFFKLLIQSFLDIIDPHPNSYYRRGMLKQELEHKMALKRDSDYEGMIRPSSYSESEEDSPYSGYDDMIKSRL